MFAPSRGGSGDRGGGGGIGGAPLKLQSMFVLCGLLLLVPQLASSSILEKLSEDTDLSQTASLRKQMPVRFYSLLESNQIANSTLSLRACTLFVPTNEAFQRHKNKATYVLYHMATVAMTQDQLTKTIPSDMDGNPPLYITKNRNGDIYVNNARIIPSLSVEMTNHLGKRQVMHIIDEVLVPLTPLPNTKTEITNPDAFQFLQQSDLLDIGEDNRLRVYRSQVTLKGKENLFQSPGGHTFLLPVDDGFKATARSSLVDKKVIDGHVLLNNVIFTAAAPMDVPQTTAAFEDNIKVTVTFFKEKNGIMYAKSNTLLGDNKHATGVVLSEIVAANIPVRNGVVHLIKRPLMIVDTTVTEFLQEHGALKAFFDTIMSNGGYVLNDIKNYTKVTILAPSNEAWENPALANIRNNTERMREILNMHIIRDPLNIENIKQKNQNMIAQVPTLSNHTFLYFNINGEGDDEVITVEGGGVNATIVQADVANTNGFVHIIDKVLGVPSTTVLGKLESDPMLSDTYRMGQFSSFNEQLNNTQRHFTYFVPRDKGWQKTELDHPSVHKKLFMRDFSYHSRAILERHLVIADQVYTMKDLVAMSRESDSIVLPTFRDSLKIRVEEEAGRYVIIWNHKKINVYRPDVECVNGIIHVIDYPMLEEKDVVASGGSYQIKTNFCILFATLFIIIAIGKQSF
ncbi:fasciclin-1 isoform X3 [Stomoxys calcitrans]|uniref:fasciclin-1 isoform X3 n=1 Tax=Stomoxys calcitrans TaxID=35570 RepID=UPI0027E24157|nr:fasciclin-1 isoform X3 [Stomoxys calcitrans]